MKNSILIKEIDPNAQTIFSVNDTFAMMGNNQFWSNGPYISQVLAKQEKLMSGLEDDLWQKIYNKKDGFAKDKTTFWVREALKPQRAQVEKEGAQIVDKIFGNKNQKGLYDEVLDIYRKHLDSSEMGALDEILKNGTVVVSDQRDGLFIKTKEGILKVLEIQGENAKRMSIQDYLRGNSINQFEIFN